MAISEAGSGISSFVASSSALEMIPFSGVHLVRQGEGNLVAQVGQFFFRLVAHGLDLAEPRFHGGVKLINLERLRQIIIRAERHALPHPSRVGQTRHQDERDRSGRRILAQFRQ